MKILHKICFVSLIAIFLPSCSTTAGDCWEEPYDIADCRVKAENGDASAQNHLGFIYYGGKGVVQDYVMAHMHWNIVSVSGYKDAIKNRGIVEKKMTATQIAEAQKLAREWMSKHQ